MSHCIMIQRDTKFTIVSPFDTQNDAADWARKHWSIVHGDPRWQTLELADPHAAPVVLAPSDPAAVAAIQE